MGTRPLGECVIKNLFSYLLTKIYVVGSQKNCLRETVQLNTQNTLKLKDENIFTISHSNFLFILPMGCIITLDGPYLLFVSITKF